MMQKSTLRPGLLVSLKTAIRGNVAYTVEPIEAEHTDEAGALRARWQTERVIADPKEHEEAIRVRSRCRALVTAVCSWSSFGLLCPEVWEGRLQDAVEEAQALADEFNATAQLSHIQVYVLVGRIAADDVEAMRAINAEIRDLMSDMERGLATLDVSVVRAAAAKARGLGAMLSDSAATRVQETIDMARSVAREIVRAGETGAIEIDRAAIESITRARLSFLDIGDEVEVEAPATRGRGIDLSLPTEREVDEIMDGLVLQGRQIDA